MKRRLRAGLVFLTVVMLSWHWEVIASDWNLTMLMNELAARSSGRAQFSEQKFLAVLDAPINQSGTLAFAPGHLEKITQRPYRERMTVAGNTLVIESGPDNNRRQLQLDRYPALQGFIEGVRATLTGDLKTLQQFYRVALHGSPEDWELVMIPSRPEMAEVVRLVSIMGAHNRIATIEVVQKNGDRSVMRITETN